MSDYVYLMLRVFQVLSCYVTCTVLRYFDVFMNFRRSI